MSRYPSFTFARDVYAPPSRSPIRVSVSHPVYPCAQDAALTPSRAAIVRAPDCMTRSLCIPDSTFGPACPCLCHVGVGECTPLPGATRTYVRCDGSSL
jgi:hypothetical protein